MRKMRTIFSMLCVALAFAACSNDDLLPDDGGNGGVDPRGESWVSVAVVPSASTRGLNTPNQEAATAPESTINSVRAIFFDKSDGIVTKDFTLSAAEQGGDAFKVPSTSTKVLVIVNPSAVMPTAFAAGTPFTTVNAAIADDVANVANVGGSNFMMSNAKGELETITLYNTQSDAEKAPTSLYVDRVVAKVRVYINATSETTNVTVDEAGWTLNVTNKRFFPMSKRVKTALDTSTPFDRYGLGSYRVDPNYDNSTNLYKFGGNDTENAAYIANYNYYPSTATPTPSVWQSSSPTATDALYCLENTQDEGGNYHAYTTQALVKAKFTPTLFYLPGNNGTTTNSDSDGDWLAIGKSNFYTLETIVDWIEAELTAKYHHAIPSEFITSITTAYNAFLDGIGQTPVDIETTPDSGVSETEAAIKAAAVASQFAALSDAVKANGAAQVGNVSYYSAGVSYYKIMIKHDDSNDSGVVNQLGEFGVVRNAIYDIKITKFNNPGFPVIPEPDPDFPDETDQGWLSLQIDINPWTWYTQEEPL